MLCGFIEGIAAIRNRVLLFHLQRKVAPIWQVPGILKGAGIVFLVLDVSASLQNEVLQALFTEGFGGPAAADARGR